jgi:hypothetical protein
VSAPSRRAQLPNGTRARVDARIRNGIADQASRGMRKLEAAGMKRPPLTAPGTPFTVEDGDIKVKASNPDGCARTRDEAHAIALRQARLTDPTAKVEYAGRDARIVVFRRVAGQW